MTGRVDAVPNAQSLYPGSVTAAPSWRGWPAGGLGSGVITAASLSPQRRERLVARLERPVGVGIGVRE